VRRKGGGKNFLENWRRNEKKRKARGKKNSYEEVPKKAKAKWKRGERTEKKGIISAENLTRNRGRPAEEELT